MNKYIITLTGYEYERVEYSLESSLSKEEIVERIFKKGYGKKQIFVETLEEFWKSRKSNYIKFLLK